MQDSSSSSRRFSLGNGNLLFNHLLRYSIECRCPDTRIWPRGVVLQNPNLNVDWQMNVIIKARVTEYVDLDDFMLKSQPVKLEISWTFRGGVEIVSRISYCRLCWLEKSCWRFSEDGKLRDLLVPFLRCFVTRVRKTKRQTYVLVYMYMCSSLYTRTHIAICVLNWIVLVNEGITISEIRR